MLGMEKKTHEHTHSRDSIFVMPIGGVRGLNGRCGWEMGPPPGIQMAMEMDLDRRWGRGRGQSARLPGPSSSNSRMLPCQTRSDNAHRYFQRLRYSDTQILGLVGHHHLQLLLWLQFLWKIPPVAMPLSKKYKLVQKKVRHILGKVV